MANVYRLFQELLPKAPLLVGTVLSHGAGNTSRVEYPGGGVQVVLGQEVDIGAKAFVKDGRLQGEAPNLPQETVEV